MPDCENDALRDIVHTHNKIRRLQMQLAGARKRIEVLVRDFADEGFGPLPDDIVVEVDGRYKLVEFNIDDFTLRGVYDVEVIHER